jgi:alkylhydroperoxidase family enzyme
LPAGHNGGAGRGNHRIWKGRAIGDIEPIPPIDEAALEATLEAIAESRGYVSNLMQTLALAPDGLRTFAQLGDYCRFGSQLSELRRELTILIAVRDVHYHWTCHEVLARSAGATAEQLALIREGRTPRSLPPAEYALCDYAFEITAGRRVPPRVAEALHKHFNARQIVDIALLTAYFMAAAALVIGLEVSVAGDEELAIEKERQRERLGPI